MRNALLLLTVLLCGSLYSQEKTFSAGYCYFYSPQFDKAIQTYNFSHPELLNNQPLLQHGLGARFSIVFPSEKMLSHGFGVAYTLHGSTATNPNFETNLRLHLLRFNYVLAMHQPSCDAGAYASLSFSAVGGGLFRYVNNEAVADDGKSFRGLGIGAEISGRYGYRFCIGETTAISPFVELAISPFYYSPNTEAVLNQTKTLATTQWSQYLVAQVGCSVHFVKNE